MERTFISAEDGRESARNADENDSGKSPVARVESPESPVSGARSIAAKLDQARRRMMTIDGVASEADENRGMTHFFQNPGQGIVARAGRGETHLEIPGGGFRGSLRYSGAGDETFAEANGTRLLLNHPDGVVEWFENSEEGIEQGFELPERLSASGVRMVRVELGGLSAAFAPNGDDLVWEAPEGTPLFSYSGLTVEDARGVELAARMIPDGNAFHIMIDDKDAVYPVSVDPLITTLRAKVNPPAESGDGVTRDSFGAAVATDGERLVIGARRGDGSVYVFVKDGANWALETKILPPDGPQNLGGKDFGSAVAIKGDQIFIGSSNFVGPLTGPNASMITGAVHVYTKTGADWVLTQWLRPIHDADMPSFLGGSSFGYSLAVDDDVLVIGTNGSTEGVGGSPRRGYVCIFRNTMGIWTEEARLMSPQGQLGDGFGYSVAVEGESIVIGRPYLGAGDAFVFSKQGGLWTEEVKWTGSLNGDRFGHSVAISGDRVAVGASAATTAQGSKAGSVRVFRKSSGTWGAPAILQPTGGAANHGFGSSLAFDGNDLLVGAPASNSNRGGASFFTWNGSVWQQTASFARASGSFAAAAGSSVALTGDAAYLGAPRARNGILLDVGVVHHFTRSGGSWLEQLRVSSGDGDSGQLFGTAVALDSERLVVGMQEDHTPYGNQSGSAYLFKKSGDEWNLETILMDQDPGYAEYFGASVAIEGGRLVVGNPKDGGGASVVCFSFSQNEWTIDAKLRPATGTTAADFGSGVSLEGDLVLTFATSSTIGGASTGAGFVFRKSGSTWSSDAVLIPSGVPGTRSRAVHAVLDSGRAYILFPMVGETGIIQEYVPTAGQWVEGQRIVNSVAGQGRFGNSFAVSGSHLIAPDPDQRVFAWMLDSGGVWRPNGELQRPEGSFDSMAGFGMAVAVDGGTVAVESVGKVSVYKLSAEGWSFDQALSGIRSDHYGSGGDTLAIHGEFVAVGIPGDDVPHPVTGDLMPDQGSVFVFELGEPYVRMELRNPEQQVVLASENRDLQVVQVDQSGPWLIYRIHNFGTIALGDVSIVLEGDDPGDFFLNKPAGVSSIAAGESIEFRVSFSPRSSGRKTAMLKVSSDDVAAGTKTIHLAGNGNSGPSPQSHVYLSVPGNRTVIFLKDLSTDADGDELAFTEQATINAAWGSYTVFRDRIEIIVASGFFGQFPVNFVATDIRGGRSHLSATIRTSNGPTAGPDRPAINMGDGRWNVLLRGAEPLKSYRVEHSSDMIGWSLLGIVTTDNAGEVTLIDHAGSAVKGFYRLAN